MKTLCRELNGHGRLLYKTFSERVGRNVYPLIVASDHEPEFSGVGTTFTLFLEDGKLKLREIIRRYWEHLCLLRIYGEDDTSTIQ